MFFFPSLMLKPPPAELLQDQRSVLLLASAFPLCAWVILLSSVYVELHCAVHSTPPAEENMAFLTCDLFAF